MPESGTCSSTRSKELGPCQNNLPGELDVGDRVLDLRRKKIIPAEIRMPYKHREKFPGFGRPALSVFNSLQATVILLCGFIT